ncbi:hypothetical protein ES703_109682 [subsurface metagenome]
MPSLKDLSVVPPAVLRYWNLTPFSGVTSSATLRESGSSVSRIITPALAHGSVLSTLSTFAIIAAAPVISLKAKWNSSELAQISAPAAVIV